MNDYKFLNRISELSKDELISHEFFDELFSKDDVDRKRLKISIKERVKEVKLNVGDWEDIFNAREDKQKAIIKAMKQGFFQGESKTLNFGQDKELLCGIWDTSMAGVFWNDTWGMKCACSHPIYPDQIYCNVQTGEYKVKLKYYLRGSWRETIVSKSDISSSNRIVSLADKGIQVTSENAKLLVKFLNEVEAMNNDKIIESQSTSKFGWLNDKFMPYCEGIEFDNQDALRPLFKSISKAGTFADWIVTVSEIRKTKRLELQLYFAASLASVLIEPYGSLPFIVSLFGGTGLGKTVALMYASSIWGNPCEGGYLSDAKSTPTALEAKLDCLNNMPLMIDDIAQVQYQYEGKFSSLIYAWCSGRGKERSNVNLGLNKPGSWRCCILTNGERSLAAEVSQGGAVNRIIEIELIEELFKNGQKVANVFRKNYGYFGEAFVDRALPALAEEGHTWQEVMIREVDQVLARLRKKSEESEDLKEDKQLIPMALMLWVDKFVEERFFRDGILIDEDRAFDLLLSKDDVSEGQRCYEYIIEQLAIHHGHFTKDEDTKAADNIDVWGFYKGDETAVIFVSAFEKLIRDGGFQPKTFYGWAKTKELIKCDKKKYKKLVRWSNKRVYAIFLKLPSDLNVDPETGFVTVDDESLSDLPFDV